MQKFKIISKYFFNDEYLKFTLKTKFFLVKTEFENMDKINNLSFLHLIKNFEFPEKQNPKKHVKLIDHFLNLPIENFLIMNILFSKFAKYLKTILIIKQISTSFSILKKIKFKRRKSITGIDRDKIKGYEFPPHLTDEFEKEVLLYQFEMDFIKLSLNDKAKFTHVPKELNIINNKILFGKKLSNIHSQNKTNSGNSQEEVKTQESGNIQKTLKDKIKTKEDNIHLNSINHYYYLKLLKKLKKKERQFFSRRTNTQSELKILQLGIRNKKVFKIKELLKPVNKLINLKNMQILINIMEFLLLKIKKLLLLCKNYYLSLQEKREEIEVNNNINQENKRKRKVEEKNNNFQESEKSKEDIGKKK